MPPMNRQRTPDRRGQKTNGEQGDCTTRLAGDSAGQPLRLPLAARQGFLKTGRQAARRSDRRLLKNGHGLGACVALFASGVFGVNLLESCAGTSGPVVAIAGLASRRSSSGVRRILKLVTVGSLGSGMRCRQSTKLSSVEARTPPVCAVDQNCAPRSVRK
jgi:hypothetical protein